MPDLTAGSRIMAVDTPPAVYTMDTTVLANLSDTSYTPGSPEVGVTFTAPTTGRVLLTIGGGLRNNGSNSDRVALAPQVFEGADATGTEVLAPTAYRGISSEGITTAGDFAYRGRTTLLDGLTAGQQYYARVMYIIFGSNATCDISARDILVAPTS